MAKKSLLCKSVKHHAQSVHAASCFKDGKRFKCNINRELGAVAGTVTDAQGDVWTLYRNPDHDSGFHCSVAEFYE